MRPLSVQRAYVSSVVTINTSVFTETINLPSVETDVLCKTDQSHSLFSELAEVIEHLPKDTQDV